MMKFIQITLLWLAGILVLGHQFIPHHHHHIHQQEETNHCCTHYQSQHCDMNAFHSHEHGDDDVVCHWHQNPLVEKNISLTFIAVLALVLDVPDVENCFEYFSEPVLFTDTGFSRGRPSRAPPAYC